MNYIHVVSLHMVTLTHWYKYISAKLVQNAKCVCTITQYILQLLVGLMMSVQTNHETFTKLIQNSKLICK